MSKRPISKCDIYDHALREAAATRLRRGNSLICICVHCRAQGKGSILHTEQCCFSAGTIDKRSEP
jgi:hypothetical protein